MKELNLKKGERCLIIIAHPDDETIWMGGTVLQNKQADWTIYSLCRGSDPDREPKFRRVCEFYGAESIIDDLEDIGGMGLEESEKEIERLVISRIGKKRFDHLFTHGVNGEYGHIKHKSAHKAVYNLLRGKKIKASSAFFFNYELTGEKEHPLVRPKRDSDILIDINDDAWNEKRKIVAEMYGYPYDGTDVGYCPKIEGFKKFKNIGKR